ncbi:MAG TPA: aa3-type cytochrome c oxidase subunit IV [Nitrobacter sp.]|nr:aa3-type cytochrome c oxidase subunit IV [Nitrobacter sp.]
MSDHSGIVYSTAEGMDYPAHEKSYKSFVKLGTILASTAATVIALMAIFLT